MTVAELKEQLEKLPDGAWVAVAHELIGDFEYINRIEWQNRYNLPDGVVVLHELPY